MIKHFVIATLLSLCMHVPTVYTMELHTKILIGSSLCLGAAGIEWGRGFAMHYFDQKKPIIQNTSHNEIATSEQRYFKHSFFLAFAGTLGLAVGFGLYVQSKQMHIVN